ncbi:MAG: hypothetical protein JOZ69_24135, partial [Myxococcales bacterium]|nr:hypothetical protein [Myxococcales bacterium]
MRTRSIIGVSVSIGLAMAVGCSGGSDGAGPGGPDASPPDTDGSSPQTDASGEAEAGHPVVKPSTTPSHGSTVALSQDDSRLVVANHDVGTATVFSIAYAADSLPTLTKLAEIPVGDEPSAVLVHPDGDSAFVLSRVAQKVTKITGLQSTPVKAGEAAVGSEPTGMAMTPLGSTIYVANWVDGTVMAVKTDTMTVSATIDLNAALAASPYVGSGATDRPALAHPRAVAMTNNGDTVEDDETLYVTEFYAQQKTPLLGDASNADTNRVGIVYKYPLSSKNVSLIELPAMPDMGFQDHTGGTAGCFPNQLGTINIQGGFGYVLSVCASPKSPIGVFSGPAAAACKGTTQALADATCPGGGTGSCGSLVLGKCSTTTTTSCTANGDCPTSETCTGFTAGTCKTNCTTNAACGANGGVCVPTTGTDPSVGGTCAPNLADIRTVTAPVVSVIDLGGNKTIATANLAKEYTKYFDTLGLPDTNARRVPLFAADLGFIPGTVTAYIPAMGEDAVFHVNFDATYVGATIDSLGDSKGTPFIPLFSAANDAQHNGQLPTGIAVTHLPRPAMGAPRYAFVNNQHTRNVSVIDLANEEVAGQSAGTPTVAAASAPETDSHQQDVLEGRRLFITGLGRWSYQGQGWGNCQMCHGDSLSDNVTWYLGRGPRQPPNLDASFAKGAAAKGLPTDYRINSWEGTQDEITDHEGGIRSICGGVGA